MLAGAQGEAEVTARMSQGAWQLAGLALAAGSFFFVVLLIGFAYEWKTGALDWVRAVIHERALAAEAAATSAMPEPEAALLA